MNDTMKGKQCEYNTFKRTRYFHGMLLSDQDFIAEQQYHLAKRRLLNKMLHGWGIVCGLEVEGEPGKEWITVKPGLALDCHGNEILVCEPYKLDLTNLLCAAPTVIDPCAEQTGESNTYYVAICYKERATDQVPVYTPGGGCDDKACEYARVQEGFCLKLLTGPPSSPNISRISPSLYQQNGGRDELSHTILSEFMKEEEKGAFCHHSVPCPECCSGEHCLYLATLVIEKEGSTGKRKVKEVKPESHRHRRYVLTPQLGMYVFNSLLGGVGKFSSLLKFGNELLQWVQERIADTKDQGETDVVEASRFSTNPIAALCALGEYYVAHPPTERRDTSGRALAASAQEMQAAPAVASNVMEEIQKLRDEIAELKAGQKETKKGRSNGGGKNA
jgi:hypothetical protein